MSEAALGPAQGEEQEHPDQRTDGGCEQKRIRGLPDPEGYRQRQQKSPRYQRDDHAQEPPHCPEIARVHGRDTLAGPEHGALPRPGLR